LVHFVSEDADALVGLGELLHRPPCAVFGAVVDDDEFRDFRAGQNFFNDQMKRFFFVVNGDDDAKASGRDFDWDHRW
jgi:hypothetical protein